MTDVTLVSEDHDGPDDHNDCDNPDYHDEHYGPDDHDDCDEDEEEDEYESYPAMKVILWWKLSRD